MTHYWGRITKLLILSNSKAKEISGLRLTFDIEANESSDANKAKITVTNPNEDTLAMLQASDSEVKFFAGYRGLADDTSIGDFLFSGDIIKATPVLQGVDRVVTLECGEGEKALQESNVNKSFGPKTPIKQVIDEIAKTLPLPLADNSEGITGEFENGFSVSGKSKNALDQLSKKVGLNWTIQNGEIKFYNLNSDSGEKAVILTPDTGLLEVKKLKSDEGGYMFRALLNPAIKPGKIVIIKSKDIDDQFIVTKAKYKGDSHTGEFVVVGEVR